VHISEATLKFVGDDFEVEPGNGQERDSYLKEKGIKTFLIVENIEVVCVHVTCDFVCVHVTCDFVCVHVTCDFVCVHV